MFYILPKATTKARSFVKATTIKMKHQKN